MRNVALANSLNKIFYYYCYYNYLFILVSLFQVTNLHFMVLVFVLANNNNPDNNRNNKRITMFL